jgi:hypothetical protein
MIISYIAANLLEDSKRVLLMLIGPDSESEIENTIDLSVIYSQTHSLCLWRFKNSLKQGPIADLELTNAMRSKDSHIGCQ